MREHKALKRYKALARRNSPLGSASCSQTSKHFDVGANEATRNEKLTLTGNVLGGARAAPLKSKAA